MIPLRILIAEDDAQVSAALYRFLKGLGHEIHMAADVPAALEQIEMAVPNVVLADWLVDGGGAQRIVRSLDGGSGPPPRVIIMTGGADGMLPADLQHLPVLYKPFRLQELVAALVQQGQTALSEEGRPLCEQ
jgi:DNA-binding response OmpR family regulator